MDTPILAVFFVIFPTKDFVNMGRPWSPHPCNLTCDSKEQRKTRGTSQGASAVLDLQQQLAEELAKRKQAQYALLGGVLFFQFLFYIFEN